MRIAGRHVERQKKRGWLTLACFLLLAGGWGIYRAKPGDTPITPNAASHDSALHPVGDNPADARRTLSTTSPAPSLLVQIRRHEVNFISVLNDIRQQCLSDWTRTECNEHTRDFLQERFRTDNDLPELLNAYDQYIRYEDYVADHRAIHNLDAEAAYLALQQLRSQFIDPDIRRWMFGAEDARMAYEIALQDFISDEALKLSPVDRLRHLEQLRRQALGEFHDLFVAREDPGLYAETRRTLLQLSELNTPEEKALMAELEAEIMQLEGRSEKD